MLKAAPTLLEVMQMILGKNEVGISDIMNLISEASPKIFSYYVIFAEEYRQVLNNKILAHYMNYQIGYESISLFLFALNRKMNEIMPYFNQLYESAIKLSELDLSDNMDYFEEFNQASEKSGKVVDSGEEKSKYGESSKNSKVADNSSYSIRDSNSSGDSSSTSEAISNAKNTSIGNSQTDGKSNDDSWQKGSNTPQGNINGVRDTSYLTNLGHNTNANKNHSKTSDSKTDISNTESTVSDEMATSSSEHSSTNSSQKINEDTTGSRNSKNTITKSGTKDEQWNDTTGYLKHIYGINNSGGIIDNILKLRDAILNIDMMVISELDVCFFGLW